MFGCLLMCVTYISQIPLFLCLCVCECVRAWAVCVQKASVRCNSVYAGVFIAVWAVSATCLFTLYAHFFNSIFGSLLTLHI